MVLGTLSEQRMNLERTNLIEKVQKWKIRVTVGQFSITASWIECPEKMSQQLFIEDFDGVWRWTMLNGRTESFLKYAIPTDDIVPVSVRVAGVDSKVKVVDSRKLEV
ncbi:hypothetical protein AB6A40_011442 [Gnathostoma spinigerum]|uniref:Uncharacterized protein n=1 Tax=Gnathostoma spinigerum TaxID=75299 RepID=A0ABD6F3J2_9BILA